MHKVFVYGTLKKGFYNFREEMVSEIVEDEIKGDLYGVEGYSFPFADIFGDSTIKGEVHTLRDEFFLQGLDELEGVARGWYQRHQVTTKKGEVVWVYHYPHITNEFYKIEGGEWKDE